MVQAVLTVKERDREAQETDSTPGPPVRLSSQCYLRTEDLHQLLGWDPGPQMRRGSCNSIHLIPFPSCDSLIRSLSFVTAESGKPFLLCCLCQDFVTIGKAAKSQG